MPLSLFDLADQHGIQVEQWDFAPPVRAMYVRLPGLPAVIGLVRSLFQDRRELRCKLAEELGHHVTTVGRRVATFHFHFVGRLEVSRAEYRAMKWAARHPMPGDELRTALQSGCCVPWELAEHFDVNEEMVRFRLRLLGSDWGGQALDGCA